MSKDNQNTDYPLDIEIIKEKEKYVILESGSEYIQVKDRQSCLGLRMYLEVFELSSTISITNQSNEETLRGKARLRGGNSISFFGCNRKLDHINVSILSQQDIKNLEEPATVGFNFCGYETQRYDGYDDHEESVWIELFIHNLQFQKIKNSLEKKIIKSIYCNVTIASFASDTDKFGVDGLYVMDSLHPDYRYKILCNDERIINKKDLKTHYTKTNGRFYTENFDIVIIEKNLFDLDIGHNSDSKIEEINLNVDHVRSVLRELEQVNKYVHYCWLALLIIIAKLCFF